MRKQIWVSEGAVKKSRGGIVIRRAYFPDTFLPMTGRFYFVIRGRFWQQYIERWRGNEFPLFLEHIMDDWRRP